MSISQLLYKLFGAAFVVVAIVTAVNLAQGDMTAEEAVAALGVEGVHKHLMGQGEQASKVATYCKGKMNILDKSYKLLREDNWPIDRAIEDLRFSRQELKKKGEIIPQHIYLEYERMTRTIDRHPDKTKDYFEKRFYGECIASGY